MNFLPYTLSLGHIAVISLGLLLYVFTNRINHSRRPPGSAVAWVLLIIAFPYLGIPLYLFFGMRKATKKSVLHHAQWGSLIQKSNHFERREQVPHWAQSVLEAIDTPPAVWSDEVRFETSGEVALISILSLIDSARKDLAVCTYVLGNDEVSCRIMDALIVAAHRGVQVRLIVDAIGSLALSRANILRLQQNNVDIKRFMPIIRNPIRGKTNLRNHRKCIVVDAQEVWSGGRNLTQEYFLNSNTRKAWLDLSFRAKGDVAKVMLEIFNSDWAQASYPRRIGSRKLSPEAITHSAIDAFSRMQETWYQLTQAVSSQKKNADALPSPAAQHPSLLEGQSVQVIPSGPDHWDDTLHIFLITAIFQAKESVSIATPYFVPDDAMNQALCLAARRNVTVNLYVPGNSNHPLADIASSRALRDLARAGANIYQLDRMSHAKAYVFDHDIALVGSANFDTRSMFLNYEVLTAFYGKSSADWLRQWMRSLESHSTRFEPVEPGFARDLLEGAVRSIAFEL